MADIPLENIDFKIEEQADPRTLSLLDKMNYSLGMLFTQVRSLRLDLPKVFNIRGLVDVQGKVSVDKIDSLPPVRVNNLSELQGSFTTLGNSITQLQYQTVKAMETLKSKGSDTVKVGNEVTMKGMDDLLDAMEELKKGFNALIKSSQESKGASSGNPMKVEIVADLPRPTPLPVNHVSINSLRGAISTTLVSVGPTPTALPASNLSQRRAILVYNGSATTIYLGGSAVTSTAGMPVLASSYSPIFDMGMYMTLYGITATGAVDVRVLEISDENAGGF